MANAHDLLMAQRAAMIGGWKNPYVTDGLLAMWDGEWNAGGGDTIWEPCVGNVKLDVLNGVKETYGYRLKCLTTNEVSLAVTQQEFSTDVCKQVEIVASVDGYPLGSPGGLIQSNVFGLIRYTKLSEGKIDRSLRFETTGTGALIGYFDFGEAFSISIKSSPQSARLNNGPLVNGTRTSYTDSVIRFGGINYTDFLRSNDGKLMSIRIYSRHLTDEEASANYEIDKARFNLPDAA